MCVAHGKPCVWHMASHVCGTWQAMCVTHGMPCVIMHGHVKTYKYEIGRGGGGEANAVRGTAVSSVCGSSKEKEEEGRKGEEKGRKGKEKGRKRKEEKRRRKGRKRGKRKRKRKECCAVSRPGRQRIRNCATRGRFPPTLVILRLGAV